MQLNNIIEDAKPTLLWLALTAVGNLQTNLSIISGILSIGYTCYKIYSDYKKNKK